MSYGGAEAMNRSGEKLRWTVVEHLRMRSCGHEEADEEKLTVVEQLRMSLGNGLLRN